MEASEKVSLARAIVKNTYDLDVVAPVDVSAAIEMVFSEIDELLALNIPETRRKRHRHFNVPGTTENSYCENLFELDSSRPFLAGIRHAGGNPELPFINVTAGFDLLVAHVPDIANILKNEFRLFQPKHCAFWMKSSAESIMPEGRFKPARRYLARRITDLDLTLTESGSIEIRPIEGDSYFPWVENEYRKFHHSNSTLQSWVPVAEKDDLEMYRNQGLLFGAYLDDALIGLVGGESRSLLGLAGLYMGEILISEGLKGRGLATLVQRQFLRRVGANFEVVWGTIDARNVPSTKTALKVGRKFMRTEYFAPLG